MKAALLFLLLGFLPSMASAFLSPASRAGYEPLSSPSKLFLGPAEAWAAYNEALEASPLVVKSVTAGAILGAADLAGQALEKAQSDSTEDVGVDLLRSLRFAVFGLVLQAPWNHFYYLVLDGQIPPTPEPFTPTNGVKVVIDQFVQAPIFTVLIFVFLGLLEGKSTDAIKKQLDDDYQSTIIANCTYAIFVKDRKKLLSHPPIQGSFGSRQRSSTLVSSRRSFECCT